MRDKGPTTKKTVIVVVKAVNKKTGVGGYTGNHGNNNGNSDVDDAVKAAESSLQEWQSMGGHQRSRCACISQTTAEALQSNICFGVYG